MTKANLAKQGWIDSDSCPLCGTRQSETVSHMLATCSYAQQIWQNTYNMLGIAPQASMKNV